MRGRGYIPATDMTNRRGTNLDEQDLEEQFREEAYTEAWETSLSKAQGMMDYDCDMNRDIARIVEVIATTIMIEKNVIK